MNLKTLVLLAAGFASMALGYREGDKIYAQVSDIDLGHGTTVYNGLKYAFKEAPGKDWYISNANGTEKPHWKYLPHIKTSPAIPDNNSTDDNSVGLDKRQTPPQYINYYNNANCDDFDAQNRPVTLNQCVWNRALVAWSSSFTPAGGSCRYITNYYNSGCGFGSTCSGYITQTVDFTGCFNPRTVFCSTFTTCCLSGC
ncbi:hypothetical protein TARUN_3305 [Trichoderma arundinaceum]|uniref:Uncharacterized protein n=1 Tax=Trichoderma arundinaceum TaxID=490622 RepID=A0A395NSA3_TRIAR|nr:hypothetical protein TARUN_3305 [Trichoderma arundinaceum]